MPALYWKKLSFLLLFVLLFSADELCGQGCKISGAVTEAKSGKPVENATLRLLAVGDSNLSVSFYTDAYGHFSGHAICGKPLTLVISCAGFAKQIISDIYIKDGDTLRLAPVKLVASTHELQAVTIKAEKKLYTQEIDRLVVNVDALVSNAGTNTADLLELLPGVAVNEGSISIKGREGAMVMIDGKQSWLSGNDLMNYLKGLPAGSLDKIEIITNPTAKYPAAGSAGIINIRTKKNKAGGFNASLTLNYGQGRYAKTNNSCIINFRKNKINYFANISYVDGTTFFDAYKDRVYRYDDPLQNYAVIKNNRETNTRRSFNYKAGADMQLNKSTMLGAFVSSNNSRYREPGFYQNTILNNAGLIDSVIWSESFLRTKTNSHAINLNLVKNFAGAQQELSVNADYFIFKDRAAQTLDNFFYTATNTLKDAYTLVSVNPFTAKIYSLKADYSRNFLQHGKMEAGAQAIVSVRNNRGDYTNRKGNISTPDITLNNAFNYHENINAAYINFQQNYTRFSVQAGLRMENTSGRARQYERFGKPDTSFNFNYTDLFPTAYILYRLDSTGQQTLAFSYGRRISRPGYGDLNPSMFFFDPNTTLAGNNLLQPQYASNFELSYTHAKQFIIGFTYSKTKDNITQGQKQVGTAFISTNRNLEAALAYGINITAFVSPVKWWTSNNYIELTNNTYRGKLFPDAAWFNRSIVTFRLTASQQFTFNRGWKGDLTFNMRTKVLYGQSVLQPAWQLHAGVQKKLGERGSISLAARDIFHSWVLKRQTSLANIEAGHSSMTDTQVINLACSWRFGGGSNAKERRSGIQAEAGRAGGR